MAVTAPQLSHTMLTLQLFFYVFFMLIYQLFNSKICVLPFFVAPTVPCSCLLIEPTIGPLRCLSRCWMTTNKGCSPGNFCWMRSWKYISKHPFGLEVLSVQIHKLVFALFLSLDFQIRKGGIHQLQSTYCVLSSVQGIFNIWTHIIITIIFPGRSYPHFFRWGLRDMRCFTPGPMVRKYDKLSFRD